MTVLKGFAAAGTDSTSNVFTAPTSCIPYFMISKLEPEMISVGEVVCKRCDRKLFAENLKEFNFRGRRCVSCYRQWLNGKRLKR